LSDIYNYSFPNELDSEHITVGGTNFHSKQFVYTCIDKRDVTTKKGKVEVPLTGLIQPHVYACPK